MLGLTSASEPNAERLYARRGARHGSAARAQASSTRAICCGSRWRASRCILPPHKRVLGYEVWFEPLPRTTTGKLKRHEIERRLRASSAQSAATAERSSEADERGRTIRTSAAALRGRAPPRARRRRVPARRRISSSTWASIRWSASSCSPSSNSEFGVRVPEEQAHEIFTLGPADRRGAARSRPGNDPAAGRAATGRSGRNRGPCCCATCRPADRSGAGRPSATRRPCVEPLLFLVVAVLPRLLGPRVVGQRPATNLPQRRRVPHLPQPSELRGSVLRLRRCCPTARPSTRVLRRRGGVLRDAADVVGGAEDQPACRSIPTRTSCPR